MFGKFCKICNIQYRRCILYWIGCIYIFLIIVALFNRNSRCKYNMPDVYQSKDSSGDGKCFVDLHMLGLVTLNVLESPSMREIERHNFHVTTGGLWKPTDCEAIQKVAVIIPYRDRLSHLKLLLHRLHPMLQKQKLNYRIFVVEQAGTDGFNSGRLQNIGVIEALKEDQYDCFILHDVDLIPEHDGNLYVCDDHFRHLASAINEMRYHVMYYNSVGGVAAVSYRNLLLMNGHNNDYWGWGNEDDDFGARSEAAGLLITRPPEQIGRYKMVRHPKSWREDDRYDQFLTWRSKWKKDGLNTVAKKYKVLSTHKHRLYTNITADLGRAPARPPDEGDLAKESVWWLLQFFFP